MYLQLQYICKIIPIIVGLKNPQTSLNFFETIPYTNFLTLRNRKKKKKKNRKKMFCGIGP